VHRSSRPDCQMLVPGNTSGTVMRTCNNLRYSNHSHWTSHLTTDPACCGAVLLTSTTTDRCWHTATLLHSGNSEKVHLLNPKDITPLDSHKMSADHKMLATLTLLLSLDINCVNISQKNEYFNTYYKICPLLTPWSRVLLE
jgi:hypothetical protein